VCALATNRQITTVAQATVATKVHQTFDVHLHFAAQVTFDFVVGVDMLRIFRTSASVNSFMRRVVSMPTASQIEAADVLPIPVI